MRERWTTAHASAEATFQGKAPIMADAAVSPTPEPGPLDAVVIGAGFAGLYMLYRLREQGFSVHGFEQGDGVGGTWYWNRYPGARCDSEIMYYSFSFMPDLEQEWPLEERYPGQPEILRYLEHVAGRLDLRQDFTFGARVIAVEYDEAANLWTRAHRAGPHRDSAFRHHRGGLPVHGERARVQGRGQLRRALRCTPGCGRASRWTSPASGSA